MLAATAWSPVINNPYFPLLVGSTYVYTGTDDGDPEIDRVIVTDATKQVLGVTTTVILDRVYINGVLSEKTEDYYAQDSAGNVWYFGENSRELDANGNVTSREGSWLAGENNAKAGIIMPAHPGIGDKYTQENSPDVAQDQAEVIALNGRAQTPFGTFSNCLLTNETSPLEPAGNTEMKLYAAGIGEVKEVSSGDEVEILKLRSYTPGPSAFADTIDNPNMPVLPGATWIYTGIKDGEPLKQRVVVQDYTQVVDGVICTVVLDRVFVNGELEERTHDFFAQDLAGNVWYFGEHSRDIQNGQVVSTEGSWEAGVNGATAGIVMLAQPGVGDHYAQEHATGVAEDEAVVLSANGGKADTAFGRFSNCLVTQEFTKLEPDLLENKYYARGIGLVKSQSVAGEQEIVKLVDYFPGPLG